MMLADQKVGMEWLDIVDERDDVMRCVPQTLYRGPEEGWIRFSAVFLTNVSRKIWIPTRAAHKRLFPGCLDVSAGGHVRAGESYLEAARRETEEETGLVLPEQRFQLLATFRPLQNGTFCFISLFHVELQSEQPQLSQQDHERASWMDPEMLLALLRHGAPARRDLELLLQSFRSFCSV